MQIVVALVGALFIEVHHDASSTIFPQLISIFMEAGEQM
jgi:hypothetical protein